MNTMNDDGMTNLIQEPNDFYLNSHSGNDLLKLLLADQQQLTAVENFGLLHDSGEIPAQARYYSRLLPAQPCGPGQQYGFEVDLDRCSGCKACVVACHSLNGLDVEETWREVGLLIGGTIGSPVMQHVTTACHHCVEPACLTACPVDAYEKDPITGIVRHLDDQCFGCQYCTLACPYEVPKYHSGKGIVRKCDMCVDRLATGEAPACVQSCPHEAIAIRVIDLTTIRDNAETHQFLPGAPEPYLTYPSTVYKSKVAFPRNMLPADYHTIKPQHAHWPLIVMLVLSQLSVGGFTIGLILGSFLNESVLIAFRSVQSMIALTIGLLALAASTLHLGRPQYAFRAIIGLRHSWLSREILAFGIFAGTASVYVASLWVPNIPTFVPRFLEYNVVFAGIAGVICSAMIYAATRREFWNVGSTFIKFGLSTINLGIVLSWLSITYVESYLPTPELRYIQSVIQVLVLAVFIGSSLKLLYETSLFLHLLEHRNSALKRSARIMAGPLSHTTLARFALGLLSGSILPYLILTHPEKGTLGVYLTALLLVVAIAGEILERYLFFAAVSAPRMPGGPRP